MSASLVGSEMCIRDRPCTPCCSPGVLVRPRILRLRRAPGSPVQVIRRGCLLYTSDAADDM
eukprot:4732451-Alexandrium_andersonii.AAC.1